VKTQEETRLLKEHTKSLCPECFDVIEAQVVEENGCVFLKKSCALHGSFSVIIEKDPSLYKALYNKEYIPRSFPFANLSLSVSHKCNLNCPVCYVSPLGQEDNALEDLRAKIKNFQGKMILLTGGEPTLRDDLLEIIKFTRLQGKVPVLITNGVKLADARYVKALKEAGLAWVHFSFNGFHDTIYRKINGQPLYAAKMKALKNLKRTGLKTALSLLYAKGINEKEISRVFRFCLKNHSFIRQFRIRAITKNGCYLPSDTIFLSELVEKFGEVIGLDKTKIVDFALRCNYDNHHERRTDPMPCHLEFDVALFLERYIAGNVFTKLKKRKLIMKWFVTRFGILDTINIVWEYFVRARGRFSFSVKLRSWTDKQRIDLGEMQHCLSAYSLRSDGGMLPFCQAIVLNEKHSHI